MNIPGPLDLKNQISRARWAWTWHLQGGSSSWRARDFADLRNDEELLRYRVIEVTRRHTPYGRRVVSLEAWKFEQKQRGRHREMVAAS